MAETLEDPITLDELQRSIGTTKLGKVPRPDGLTIQYYKTLLPSLCHFMVKMFNALGSGMSLSKETLQAHISVIPTEGKDPTRLVGVIDQYPYSSTSNCLPKF